MTGNLLKIIACISMLADHIGVVLFPQAAVLRYLGRLAMPIFAYFIAEGCRHTSSGKKYFLRVAALATLCQLVYAAEELLSGSFQGIYLNILFTFALSIPICRTLLKLLEVRNAPRGTAWAGALFRFLPALAAAVFVCCFAGKLFGIDLTVDYGLAGVLLPVFAVPFSEKRERMLSFTLGLLLLNLSMQQALPFTWYSLLTLPLLLCYNGRRGRYSLKWVFYLFYPLHLAVIYGIGVLLGRVS